MTDPLDTQKRCELHVHAMGCPGPAELVEMGREIYADVDWSPFVERYERMFGTRPDPVDVFGRAVAGEAGGLRDLADLFLMKPSDAGSFDKFGARAWVIHCLNDHLIRTAGAGADTRVGVERFRREGIRYVEVRNSCTTDDQTEFEAVHGAHIDVLRGARREDMDVRYIAGLRRNNADTDYDWLRALIAKRLEIADTVIGIDFMAVEEGYPPRNLRSFFERVRADNEASPEHALDVVYHVGECFFDKSVESAIRWCHEAAEMGAKRLGHAIALGMDPAVAISRQPDAHVEEPATERLDQIGYDLRHRDGLVAKGVCVDVGALEGERERLGRDADGVVRRMYDAERLGEIRARQDYVLGRLAAMGTVIECCPTSNLLIGGVPSAGDHPIRKLLASEVNVAICSDDPGIFGTSLAEEVDWVRAHSGWTDEALAERLGDPWRFRLGQGRV